MKYLKKYHLFESHDEIYQMYRNPLFEICSKYNIENYTINSDETIDVDDHVYLSNIKSLTKLPLRFNKVSGDFYCDNNQFTSLKGAPKKVGGNFSCTRNQLTSLECSPKEVGGNFDCSYNQITSLEGVPKEVGGYLYCRYNQLMDLNNLPNVSKRIYLIGNPVNSIVYEWIKDPEERWEKWEYFQDLSIIQGDQVIFPRLEEFHEVMEIPMPNLNEIKKYYKIIQ